jgi:MYXO-CTERM domain-containing protein
MIGEAIQAAIPRSRHTRVVIVALLAMLGFGSLLRFFGSVVARAQTGSAPTSGTPIPTPTEGAVLVLTPPPSPCAAAPAGPCPNCTSSVPGASDYENSLPVPSPAAGFNYVVQLVNESNVTILAGADAAHQGNSTPDGPVPPPIAVEPREGTWVMQPKGSPNNTNILTIDIPMGWEGTVCPQTNTGCGALGPRFWPRTGCKYDIEHDLAQCETGDCGDAYDCGQQALRNPPQASVGQTPTSIVEWTFNSQYAQGYEYPDISLVDGVTLTLDVQALGLHCASNPGQPTNQFWLSQRQPLAVHGADLRDASSCIPSFQLTRGEVGQIIQGQGNPDDVVACFTNCGRYEYPTTPSADCDPATDKRCKNWLAFCCFTPIGDPNHVYGGACPTPPAECAQSGGCWNNGSMPCTAPSDCPSGFSCLDGVCAQPFCACRAFIKNEDCLADVCTHQYSSHDRGSQPPFGHCTDVSSDASACIGDDTVHAVFPGGYTWPNDPQTYVSDARVYRIIFAPGYTPGTNPPITDSGPIPACDSLPEAYGYASQSQLCSGVPGKLFAGAALSPTCTTNDDCPFQPGITPPKHFSCDTATQRCSTWSCSIAPGGPVTTGTLLCSWSSTTNPSPTPTSTRGLGGTPPTTPAAPTATHVAGSDSSGCAITPDTSGSNSGLLLAFVAVGGALLRTRRRTHQ